MNDRGTNNSVFYDPSHNSNNNSPIASPPVSRQGSFQFNNNMGKGRMFFPGQQQSSSDGPFHLSQQGSVSHSHVTPPSELLERQRQMYLEQQQIEQQKQRIMGLRRNSVSSCGSFTSSVLGTSYRDNNSPADIAESPVPSEATGETEFLVNSPLHNSMTSPFTPTSHEQGDEQQLGMRHNQRNSLRSATPNNLTAALSYEEMDKLLSKFGENALKEASDAAGLLYSKVSPSDEQDVYDTLPNDLFDENRSRFNNNNNSNDNNDNSHHTDMSMDMEMDMGMMSMLSRSGLDAPIQSSSSSLSVAMAEQQQQQHQRCQWRQRVSPHQRRRRHIGWRSHSQRLQKKYTWARLHCYFRKLCDTV
eukprot:m.121737 g.121737  ORF g.121737 m.121737 type:complete len:360 (+) comp12928_c1_seq2:2391-3470(+)